MPLLMVQVHWRSLTLIAFVAGAVAASAVGDRVLAGVLGGAAAGALIPVAEEAARRRRRALEASDDDDAA